MAIDTELLQHDLLDLPVPERLKLAHWLLGTVMPASETTENQENPLLAFAGMFAGGPGDTAERAEEILEAEVNAVDGFGAFA